MGKVRIGVIGGTGLYQMPELAEVERIAVETPFGAPSDSILLGELSGEQVAFIPRHGEGHCIIPSELPSQANIFALKTLGVEFIISVNACGSMREEIKPLDVVIPDQLFDHTKVRPRTFFGQGLTIHISFAQPFCLELSRVLHRAAQEAGASVHLGGTFLCIEGPRFSTKGESRIYRQWGVDIIGMTVVPEAKLAREAEICYASLAMVTDYDVWHEAEETVTVDMIVDNLRRNVELARTIIRTAILALPRERACECARALRDAIVTQRDKIPEHLIRDLKPLLGKYVG